MARKKRKYVRRKSIRHDTVPLSAIFVGLLPILVMAGITGIYIVYQYTDIFGLTTVPVLPAVHPDLTLPEVSAPAVRLPAIALPEITVSFDEVLLTSATAGTAVLDTLMTTAERTVVLAGEAGTWGITAVQAGILSVIAGITSAMAELRQSFEAFHSATTIYAQTVSWTVGDFFRYLDLPGKVQAFLDSILWPLHFLDPRPAVQATSEKVNQTTQGIAQALHPVGVILSYIWDSFKETAAELWENIIEMLHFLSQLTEKKE